MKRSLRIPAAASIDEFGDSERRLLIDAAEYRKLAVSHRRLVRADEASAHLRGLRDLDTGEVFLIDEKRLFTSHV